MPDTEFIARFLIFMLPSSAAVAALIFKCIKLEGTVGRNNQESKRCERSSPEERF